MIKNLILPTDIVYGEGSIEIIPDKLKQFDKIAIVTGSGRVELTTHFKGMINGLKNNGIIYKIFRGIPPEPSALDIDNLVSSMNDYNPEALVSIGGGSVIDAGKAAAALLTNERGVEGYLESVGQGLRVNNKPLYFVAVPTVAGSGAECTKNCVITDRKKKYKRSFRDDRLIADLVVLDPQLMRTVPIDVVIRSGMDAFSQLIEVFTSVKSDQIIKNLVSPYISQCINALYKLFSDKDDLDASGTLLSCAAISGIGLTNGGLGAIHGLASGIGSISNLPHGLICAILLPHIIKINSMSKPELYAPLSEILNIEEKYLNERFTEINEYFRIPTDFTQFDIDKSEASEIVRLSMGGSMNGNPVNLSKEFLVEFVEGLLC